MDETDRRCGPEPEAVEFRLACSSDPTLLREREGGNFITWSSFDRTFYGQGIFQFLVHGGGKKRTGYGTEKEGMRASRADGTPFTRKSGA